MLKSSSAVHPSPLPLSNLSLSSLLAPYLPTASLITYWLGSVYITSPLSSPTLSSHLRDSVQRILIDPYSYPYFYLGRSVLFCLITWYIFNSVSRWIFIKVGELSSLKRTLMALFIWLITLCSTAMLGAIIESAQHHISLQQRVTITPQQVGIKNIWSGEIWSIKRRGDRWILRMGLQAQDRPQDETLKKKISLQASLDVSPRSRPYPQGLREVLRCGGSGV